jgi:Type II restriction endonuclease EcoO109I
MTPNTTPRKPSAKSVPSHSGKEKKMAARKPSNPFFAALKSERHHFDPREIVTLFERVDEKRVFELAGRLAKYISENLPAAFEKRGGLGDYRTNPYVLMTSASVMNLDQPAAFGAFLFNSKLYMALETSFGKSIESAFIGKYPLVSEYKWIQAPEKLAEFATLAGLSREDKAKRRVDSVWREIDGSCVVGTKRSLTSIKSGPNTINDTQVQGMTRAIIDNCGRWLEQTKATYSEVREIDMVLGLTYGTDSTTNNKENQILVKLLQYGFIEENREKLPGVLIDKKTRSIRVYRRIGKEFWAFIGQPDKPSTADFVFLEVLLALAKALSTGMTNADIETRINSRLQQLAGALTNLQFPRKSLPEWIRGDFEEKELFWFATAMTAFYDEGI